MCIVRLGRLASLANYSSMFCECRACIRPELSRTITFGDKGVSAGQFYRQHLQYIKLNSDPVDFMKLNLSHLKEVWLNAGEALCAVAASAGPVRPAIPADSVGSATVVSG